MVLPAPVGPTIARLEPAGILSEQLDKDPDGEGLLLLNEDGGNTRVLLLTETREDVSATKVRSTIEVATGITHDAWKTQDVPEQVADYIRKTGLYQK